MTTISRRQVLALGAVLTLTTVPSFAIFGVGDIVWDPTNYAELVTQATTAYSHYKSFLSSVEHFSVKAAWQTEESRLTHIPLRNQFGETSGFDAALTINSADTASTAWRNATTQLTGESSTYVASQAAGSPAHSQLAMVEASDATSPMCLNAVGAYRAALAANGTAQAALQDQQLDGSTGTNSTVEQLNLLNASQAQHLVELKQQGAFQACLAQQMAVSQMQQRNAAAEDLNTWGAVEQQRATNNVNPAGSSVTWTHFLP